MRIAFLGTPDFAVPAEVLTAANAGSPSPQALNARLFYAHLYLGLHYDAAGDTPRASEHMQAAVGHKIGHYMWNVADVHARMLAEAAPGSKSAPKSEQKKP